MRVEFVSELIGTFFMVFIGCLAIKQDSGEPIISLAFGGAVCVVIVFSRRFSGAHINPAVSIAFSISGELDKKLLPTYVCAQLLGGLIAGLALGGSGATDFSVNLGWGILIEVAITMALMLSIYLTIWHTNNDIVVGMIVGIVVAILAFYFGTYTGASMNPARTFGPNLVFGSTTVIPAYLTATTFGGLLAALISKKLRNSTKETQAFN